MTRARIYLICFLLLCAAWPGIVAAQSKIKDGTVPGTPTLPKPGVILELESISKGLLNTRMNTTQMLAIPVTPSHNGLMVYNTDSACACVYNGSAWKNMCGLNIKTQVKKASYLANSGDSVFNAPEIVFDAETVQVFRNGVQVNFNSTIGTKTIKLELEAYCKKDDEIRIVQIINY